MQRTLGSMALSLINRCQDGLMADRPVLHRFLHYREHGEIHTEREPSLDYHVPYELSGADWRAHAQGRSVMFARIRHHAQGDRGCGESQRYPFPFMAPLGARSIGSWSTGVSLQRLCPLSLHRPRLKRIHTKGDSLHAPHAEPPTLMAGELSARTNAICGSRLEANCPWTLVLV
jgi:hypothetical protein